jgi:hypothetical protein
MAPRPAALALEGLVTIAQGFIPGNPWRRREPES